MDQRPSLLRELAHELRDALSPVRAALDLMRLRSSAPDVNDTLMQRIDAGLARALATLDAFVLAEQCESGTAALAPEAVSVGQLLERTEESLPQSLRARCVFRPPRPDFDVRADVGRSVQVLAAMLHQALAAAAEGATVEVQADGADQPHVKVCFAAAAHARAGEAWFDTYRAPGGGGVLALRAARCLMSLQQGGLELRTREEKIELLARFSAVAAGEARPERAAAARPAAARPAAEATSSAAAGTRILIVEDNAEVRRAYREALGAMGYVVAEARNAEEALDVAAAEIPAVALIDIHLPGMNGYRLAQALKARGAGALRLVMLSGVTLDETTLRLSRDAGFDQCFDKAAGPKALQALLLRLG
jgi:CheY-like chemotaxis protein